MSARHPSTSRSRPIGILAGNGRLPGEVARSVRARGGDVVIVAINGEVDDDLAAFPLTRVGWGEIGRMLKTLRTAGCTELVIVGGVTRPDLTRVWPDLGLFRNLPELIRLILQGGDDSVSRAVVRFFEGHGFTVLSPSEVAPSLMVPSGALGACAPELSDAADMLLASSVVKALGRYDIGQGVIVAGGEIIAIEAAEGTDRMLKRVAAARALQPGRSLGQRSGVLVKRPKPSQEMRIDLPTIGPATVTGAAEAKLAGIAVLAGQTMVAERAEVITRANVDRLFVYGFTEGTDAKAKPAETAWSDAGIDVLGRRRPSQQAIKDARLGAAALASLAGLAGGGAVVVNRGYVLGLEPGGETDALLRRAVRFKAWGEGRFRRRAGVAVLGETMGLDEALLTTAGSVGLVGVAVMGRAPPTGFEGWAARADRLGLFLVRLVPSAAAANSRDSA